MSESLPERNFVTAEQIPDMLEHSDLVYVAQKIHHEAVETRTPAQQLVAAFAAEKEVVKSAKGLINYQFNTTTGGWEVQTKAGFRPEGLVFN